MATGSARLENGSLRHSTRIVISRSWPPLYDTDGTQRPRRRESYERPLHNLTLGRMTWAGGRDMVRSIVIVASLMLLCTGHLSAQEPTWDLRVDTTAGPKGCAASAIKALGLFFKALQAGDSATLAQTVAPRFGFSTGKWTPTDTFARIESLSHLAQYARKRARAGERIKLESVQFNYWRHGTELHFGPLFFLRAAPDLGGAGGRAAGKGFYICGQGIRALNLGRPA